jgi:hypothetical protein
MGRIAVRAASPWRESFVQVPDAFRAELVALVDDLRTFPRGGSSDFVEAARAVLEAPSDVAPQHLRLLTAALAALVGQV